MLTDARCTQPKSRGSDVINSINTSDLLGTPQIAGVVVSPIGLFRKAESGGGGGSGVVGSAAIGVLLADKLGGKRAAQQRARDAAVRNSTPDCGNYGYLAVTDAELALTSTTYSNSSGLHLGDLVTRVPRATITHAELAGGWQHPTLYMFSAAPLRITFTDGTAWAFEVNRFRRRRAKHLVRTLQSG
jgi:hypothetical protein